MDEKLKALANDILEQCQKQGLARWEVNSLLVMIDARSREDILKKYDKDAFLRINDILEQCQKQELTRREVKNLLITIEEQRV